MSLIRIEGMDFHAYIGCFSEEKIIGTRFVVDVEMVVDTKKAEINDNLSDTVNYQAVYSEVKTIMNHKNNLLESTARQIVDDLLDKFQQIEEVSCTIRKMNPPLGGFINNVSVSLKKGR